MPSRRTGLLAALAWLGAGPARASEADAWGALARGGHLLLMRHAQTEAGTGDPPGFRLEDCTTQRNLDARGRAQCAAWGEALRARRLRFDAALSSGWCRCLETARLIGVAPVERLPALDSFFEDRARGAAQTAELGRFVGRWQGPGNALLVSHQVNITGLTRVYPRSGEAVVLAPQGEGFTVLGRLPPPPPA